jgi:monovalent cation:H+ antiporter-2, CPA2 family
MDGITLLQDLAVVLLAAGIAGVICRRIGLSVIVGYLIAGLIIGPFNLPFSYLQDFDRVQTLSYLGLVFLMFGIGLGLSLSKLTRLGATPFIATGLTAFLVLTLSRLLFNFLGFNAIEALFLAAMLTVSSSAVIAKMVAELNLRHDRSGQLALSMTVLEDVVAVIVLTLLGAEIAIAPEDAGSGWAPLIGSLTTFVVLLVAAGLYAIPRLLSRLEVSFDKELLTIIVSGLLLLAAITTVHAGYSLALGAFLLGAMIADTPQRAAIDTTFRGLRDVFSAVFFVAIGMMIEVERLIEVGPLILGVTAITLVIRSCCAGFALSVVGVPSNLARKTALLVLPVGEFSFIIAQLGANAGVIDQGFYPLAVGVSILTILIAPVVNRRAEGIVQLTNRIEPRWARRLLDQYQSWMGSNPFKLLRGVWWQLVRKRFLQVAVELLFVAGVLSLSPIGRNWVISYSGGASTTPLALGLFWGSITLLLAVLLTALWRNIAALSMITAEALAPSSRVPQAWIAAALNWGAASLLALWLFEGIPWELLPRWSWLTLAILMTITIGFFASRLIRWHSHWLASVKASLDGGDIEPPPPSWHEQSRSWGIQLFEVHLPENTIAAGRSLAQLAIRSQYGCAIAEINRNGLLIQAPKANEVLYANDRLLLIGDPESIARLRADFLQLRSRDRFDFEEATLEFFPRLPASWIGQPLSQAVEGIRPAPLIVGIERGGQRQLNPPADAPLQAQDGLLVLGSPTQLDALRSHLATDPKS